MLLTATDLFSFNNATTCENRLEMRKCEIIVKLEEAMVVLNLMYRIYKYIWKLPVVIDNLKGYDGHLIVKALKSEFGKVGVIPQNMEKYPPLSLSACGPIEIYRLFSIHS